MTKADTFWLDVYRARLDDYKRQADQYAEIAERAGVTAEHPLVKEMSALAAEMKLEIPVLDVAPIPTPSLPHIAFLKINST